VSREHVVIAIDGPAASGKSSVARSLARRLGFLYVNTGAMYRAVTWHVMRRGVDPLGSAAVLDLLARSEIRCGINGTESHITIDGDDPGPHLTDPLVNNNVSPISTIAGVRSLLVARQREYIAAHDLVMEGRDIGSVVFPDTPYKFYIDASPEVRAQRRAAQGLRDEIHARDRQDSSRKSSPLTIAEDAEVIDSSHLTVDGVVGEIIGRLKRKGLALEE
jgi:cytidylate kinase